MKLETRSVRLAYGLGRVVWGGKGVRYRIGMLGRLCNRAGVRGPLLGSGDRGVGPGCAVSSAQDDAIYRNNQQLGMQPEGDDLGCAVFGHLAVDL